MHFIVGIITTGGNPPHTLSIALRQKQFHTSSAEKGIFVGTAEVYSLAVQRTHITGIVSIKSGWKKHKLLEQARSINFDDLGIGHGF